jgi:hypothetical protein
LAITTQDVINGALRRLGVLAEGEIPTFDMSNDGLIALNDLVDQWAAEKLMIYSIVNTTGSLTPSKQTYTVGTGGDINIARPVYIEHVNYINTSFSPTQEYPRMSPLTDDAWSKIPVKSLTAPFPTCWWYQPLFPLANLSFWPIPTSTTLQYSVYASTAVTQFAALTTAFSLPPGYLRMMRSNLALELAPDFGVTPSPALINAAQDSMSTVRRANTKMMDMSVDSASLIQGSNRAAYFSIYSGP